MSFASRVTVEGGFSFVGATHGWRGFSFTESAKTWAEGNGLWRDKNYRAQKGDWVLFNWDGRYPSDHGEVVETDDGAWMVTIGGNTSNAVKYRSRDRKYVIGFVAFSQSDQVEVAPPPPEPKVRPMYDPPLQVVARLHHPTNGGWWDAYKYGRVDFLSPTGAIVIGGMNSTQERADFGDRQIARLEPRTRNDGKAGYSIVATDGAEYVPEDQR